MGHWKLTSDKNVNDTGLELSQLKTHSWPCLAIVIEACSAVTRHGVAHQIAAFNTLARVVGPSSVILACVGTALDTETVALNCLTQLVEKSRTTTPSHEEILQTMQTELDTQRAKSWNSRAHRWVVLEVANGKLTEQAEAQVREAAEFNSRVAQSYRRPQQGGN